MEFYDQDNALNKKRINTDFKRPSLLPNDDGGWGFSEKTKAQFNHSFEFEMSSSQYYNAIDTYDKANKEIERAFGVQLPNPYIDDMQDEIAGDGFWNQFMYNLQDSSKKKGGQTSVANYKDQLDWWNNEVAKIVEKNPNVNFKTVEDFTEELKQKAVTQDFLISEMNRSSRGFMEKYGSSFAAGFANYMLDPITLQTLPLTMAYSMPKNIVLQSLKTAIMESALEFSRTSLIEGAKQSSRKSLGLDYGMDRALTAILTNTASAFVLAPVGLFAFKGIGYGGKKAYKGTKATFLSFDEMVSKNLFPQRYLGLEMNKILNNNPTWKSKPLNDVIHLMDDAELQRVFNDLPDNIKNKPKYKEAAYQLNQALIERNQNPYTDTIAGKRQHSKNVKETMKQVEVDEPITVTESPDVELKQTDQTELGKQIELKEAEIAAAKTLVENEELLDIPTFLKNQKSGKKTEPQKKLIKLEKELQKLKKQIVVPELPSGLQPPKQPKVETFLQWLKKNKIDSEEANIADVGSILDKSTFGYTKKGGYSLDQLLTRAREDGWLPPAKPGQPDDLSINDVLDLISENSVRPDDAPKLQAFDDEIAGIDQTIRALEEEGIDPVGMSNDDVDIALMNISNRVDDFEVKKYDNEDFINDFADDSMEDFLAYVEEGRIPDNERIVVDVDADGTPTAEKTVRQIKNELQNEQKMLDELTNCEGLSA